MKLADAFSSFKKSARRLELLQEYHIDGNEWETFRKFKAGEPTAIYEELAEWNSLLDSWTKRGISVDRIRVIDNPLSDYLKYQIDLGYVPSALCGQSVRFISRDRFNEISKGLINTDFWLFDDEFVFELVYDEKGAFLESREVKEEFYKSLYQELFQCSISLEEVVKQIRRQRIDIIFS